MLKSHYRQEVFSGKRILRLVRADVLRQRPLFTFSARLAEERSDTAGSLRVTINGREVARHRVSTEWRDFRFLLPLEAMGNLSGDRVVVEIEPPAGTIKTPGGGGKWEVRGLNFEAPGTPGDSGS